MPDQIGRITIVAHDVGPVGGMERQLTELIGDLLAAGVRVTLVARTCALPADPRLRWVHVPGPGRPFVLAFPWFWLVASLRTRRAAQGLVHSTGAIVMNRVDVSTVHLCHHAFASTGISRSRRRSVPYRLNAWLAAHLSRLGERWCYRPARTGTLVAVSAGLARELEQHFPAMRPRIRVVANGVDVVGYGRDADARTRLRREFRIPTGALLALFVGSEWEGKGLDIAIDAVAAAEGWQLMVVGEGDEPRYRARSRERAAEGRVHFAGRVTGAAAFYSAADAFLLPTVYETFSLVTYEAAAAGLPLLVPRVSGVEEILVDGYNGWLVDRSPEGITARLAELRADATLRAAMGARSRAAVLGHSWASMVDGYLEVYAESAGTPARKPPT